MSIKQLCYLNSMLVLQQRSLRSIITLDNKDSPSAERINLYLNTGPIIKSSLLYVCFYYILVWVKWHLQKQLLLPLPWNSCFIEISVDLYIKYQFIRERKKARHVMVTNRFFFLLISHKHGLLHNNKKQQQFHLGLFSVIRKQ